MNPSDFITRHLRLDPVLGLAGVVLYTAHAGSRLSQLASDDDPDPPAPYWAYQWAGGMALARHFESHPDLVAGKRLLDLGAGSGLVGIVAAKAGAIVAAAEIDPNGRAAVMLNAMANNVAVELVDVDIDGPVPTGVDLIAAGDVFYNETVAARMLPFLQRCRDAGIAVLIGDPQRRDLPLARLEPIASYAVGDVGDARTKAERVGSVYRLRAR